MWYLAAHPAPKDEVPRPLQCSGTEPFWTYTLYPRGAEYSNLATDNGIARSQTILSETVASNGYRIASQDTETIMRTLTVDGRICSDGMSDRPFGMSATLFNETPHGNFVQTGCCTMQVN